MQRDLLEVIVDTANPKGQNEALVSKVDKALEKGWKVYDYRGGENNGFNPYQGIRAINPVTPTAPCISVQGAVGGGVRELYRGCYLSS